MNQSSLPLAAAELGIQIRRNPLEEHLIVLGLGSRPLDQCVQYLGYGCGRMCWTVIFELPRRHRAPTRRVLEDQHLDDRQ